MLMDSKHIESRGNERLEYETKYYYMYWVISFITAMYLC